MTWGNNIKLNKSNVITKLDAGDTIIRVGGQPVSINVHFEPNANGNIVRINCPGNGCPLCNVGSKVQTKYQIPIIDRQDNEARLFEAPATVFKELKKLASYPTYGNPMNYDIKITKVGEGISTKYSVAPSKIKTPLSTEETQKLSALPNQVDSKFTTPHTSTQIQQKGLKCLPLTNDNSLDDFSLDESMPNTSSFASIPIADDNWDDL